MTARFFLGPGLEVVPVHAAPCLPAKDRASAVSPVTIPPQTDYPGIFVFVNRLEQLGVERLAKHNKLTIFGTNTCEKSGGVGNSSLKLYFKFSRTSPRANVHGHLPNPCDGRAHDVAGANRAHAVGRAAQQHVAGQEGIKRRGKFDQLRNAQNKLVRIGFLAQLTIDADFQIEVRGIGQTREEVRQQLLPALELTVLSMREKLIEPNVPIPFVYFPLHGVVSLISMLEDGT